MLRETDWHLVRRGQDELIGLLLPYGQQKLQRQFWGLDCKTVAHKTEVSDRETIPH